MRTQDLDDLFDNAAVPMHWVGPDGIILRANRAELELLGYEEDEYVGRHITEFHVDPPVIEDILARLKGRETLRDYEARVRCKDGSIRHVLISSNVLWDEDRFVHTRCFTRDVTDRRRAEEALRESEERFRLLADSAPALIWVNGQEGAEFVNRTYREFLGADPEDGHRFDWARFVHPDDRDAYLERYLAAVERRDVFEGDFRFRRHDGEYRWLRSVARPRLGAGGELLGYVGASFDITDSKEAAREREQADRRKDAFLATLAHELRNPLAPIRNAVQILDMTEGDGEIAEQARQTIERQLRQMVRLVDDLLDLSRISRDRIELRKEPVDLAVVVRNAIETSRPLLEAARHELTVSVPPEQICLHADLTRMTQVVANLLNNAAKYTPEGGHITLAVERQGQEAVLRVRDDGIGIPGEKLPEVFEMFSQVYDSRESSRGGLGIGLTLARRLVEMHGGTIEATSEGPGRGSEFVVRLPVAGVEAPAARGVSDEAERGEEAAARRVLVVDDNRDSADSLGTLLELLGNQVRIAYDGPAALAEAERFRPHVALLDIGMPEMSGHEVARRMRSHPDLRDAVLVAVTGWGQEEDRRRSQAAGFDLHLTKPADLEALEKLLGGSPAAGDAAHR